MPHPVSQESLYVIANYREGRALLESLSEEGLTSLCLRSPEGAAGQFGPLFWQWLVEQLRQDFPRIEIEDWLDCADDAGYALAALREGCERLLFSGSEEVFAKLAAIATRSGARLARREEIGQRTSGR